VSVANSHPGLIRIEAVDVEHASSLVQALVGLVEAEEVSLDGESFEVQVRTRGDSSKAVLVILDAVEAWLAADGLLSTRIHLEGRSYRVDKPVEAAGR
jgi:hypothetical protein